MKTLKLKQSQIEMPAIGLGTWRVTDEEAYRAASHALEMGYRHIDTADHYGNHREVGKAIKDSAVDRDEIFLTSKVWRENLEYSAVIEMADRFLEELQTDFVDLLLIHWPNKEIPMDKTLAALGELKNQGKTKAVGVSNFTIPHLKEARDASNVAIENNQVEFHPTFKQWSLKQFCAENGITLTAYSPLAQGEDLNLEVVKRLAGKYNRSEAQIIINWLISHDIAAVPRSTKPARMEENLKAADFEMSPEDIGAIDNIQPDDNRLLGPGYAEFDRKE